MVCVFAILPQSSCVSQRGALSLLLSVCFSQCCGNTYYFTDLGVNPSLSLSKSSLLFLSRLWLSVCLWGTLSLQALIHQVMLKSNLVWFL